MRTRIQAGVLLFLERELGLGCRPAAENNLRIFQTANKRTVDQRVGVMDLGEVMTGRVW